jgi:hypothetical protein
MEEITKRACIMIASHISNLKRVNYLIECLLSLINQTVVIPVYLSISFNDNNIKNEAIRQFAEHKFFQNDYINIYIREQKTPQMRHFLLLLDVVKLKHDWIMFCDDDDSYETTRVDNLLKSIVIIQDKIIKPTVFAGVYESHCEKEHREHRHEYWCYFINKYVLEHFYDILQNYQDIIDNKCCDVLFGEYMRRMGEKYVFGRLNMRLYNYRVTENQDSITGVIQAKQQVYTRNKEHPPLGDPKLTDYILDWNDYLHEHLEVYLHDVFLRTIVGCDINYILQAEFKFDYDLLIYVDDCHEKKMRDFHNYLRTICGKLYDVPL